MADTLTISYSAQTSNLLSRLNILSFILVDFFSLDPNSVDDHKQRSASPVGRHKPSYDTAPGRHPRLRASRKRTLSHPPKVVMHVGISEVRDG